MNNATQERMNYNMLVQINTNLMLLIRLMKEGINVKTQESHRP